MIRFFNKDEEKDMMRMGMNEDEDE